MIDPTQDVLQLISRLNDRRLNQLQAHPIKNRSEIKSLKQINKSIQAMSEGQRDILNTRITAFTQSVAKEVDKNNYGSYSSQVSGAYEMYKSKCNYGSELLGGIIDTRVAFIAGEGLSVIAEDGEESETQKFIDNFLEKNKLNGSRLMQMVLMGELEGKNLVTLTPYKPVDKPDEWHIKARSFSWYVNEYKIITDEKDPDEVLRAEYKTKDESHEPKKILADSCVYVKLGGTEENPDETTNRIHRVLTDIENFSRAKYDLRKNTHVFGKYMPYWKTESAQAATMINNALKDKSFEIGDGYAGQAEFGIVEPSGGGADAITKDALMALRCISSTTGVPVHWMAWPDLMSNRATADNLMEVVKSATQKERLIWEEAFTEIIKKAIKLAIDSGFEGVPNSLLSAGFTVKLPLVSLALLQQMIDIWKPLLDAGLISEFTIMNMLPGINPAKEKKQIKKEQEEKAEQSPFNNGTVDGMIKQMQQGENMPLGKNMLPGKNMPSKQQKQGGANGNNAD